ncbi:hypothetical protein CUMW_137790, partial [Citrus unshiu]
MSGLLGRQRACLAKASKKEALIPFESGGECHICRTATKEESKCKTNIATEEDVSDIAGEGFLHNHQECIKAQTKAVDIDEILRTVGLDNGFLKQAEPLQLSELMPVSPPRYLELQELPEEQLEDPSPWKYDRFSDLDSPPPCRSLKSPNLLWKDHDADFMLTESP